MKFSKHLVIRSLFPHKMILMVLCKHILKFFFFSFYSQLFAFPARVRYENIFMDKSNVTFFYVTRISIECVPNGTNFQR